MKSILPHILISELLDPAQFVLSSGAAEQVAEALLRLQIVIHWHPVLYLPYMSDDTVFHFHERNEF